MDALILFIIFLMTVTFHEVSHGFIAYLRGDKTALYAGRLTLNPLRHIDWFWTIIFPIMMLLATAGRFSLGMAKPVPVDFTQLKNQRMDTILVAGSGPLANIIFAWMLATAFHLTHFEILLYGAYLNLGLAFFNLIPIPPLDGSRIVSAILPNTVGRVFSQIEPFGFMIILLLYMTHMLFPLIMPGINLFSDLLGLPKAGF